MGSIEFPNLHIAFENVNKSISIFGFDIAYYGMVIALGVLVALFYILREAKRCGQSEDSFMDVFFAGLILGIIGARVYYVAFSWDMYKDNLISVFNLREGGLAIYGGVIFGALGVLLMCKKKKISFPLAADIVIGGVLIGQIFGRWGNFFNREAFGDYTDNLLAMRLPVTGIRSFDDVTPKMLEHLETINGVDYISVHPTFLYESCLNLCVLLFILIFRKHKKWDGQVFCIYLLCYGIIRFFIEGLRTDQLKLVGTDLPVSRLLSVILVILSASILIFKQYSYKKHQ